jgi:hypothetical protein
MQAPTRSVWSYQRRDDRLTYRGRRWNQFETITPGERNIYRGVRPNKCVKSQLELGVSEFDGKYN